MHEQPWAADPASQGADVDTATLTGRLVGLSALLVVEHQPDQLIAASLPLIREVAMAEAVVVLSSTPDGSRVSAHEGRPLTKPDEPSDIDISDDSVLTVVPVPLPWKTEGIGHVAAHRLPGAGGVLMLAWGLGTVEQDGAELALSMLDAGLARCQSEAKLADLATRVDSAQQLAHMGDYDWHIASDVNTWSDQLFRIYGHEPQSFQPSYEKFLSQIHPDDRDRISALHQDAYATGEPFQMIERIVRPDGEVRFLSSNGEVIMDDSSTPVRMRGTCIDITERVLVEREREGIAARFQGLVDSAPDAILVLGEDQVVLEANRRAHELLGGDPQGHGIHEILPSWPHGGTTGVHASALDGREVELDLNTVVVNADDASQGHTLVALFLRDARSRLEREAVAAHLAEANLKRQHALEINDNVVQGLVAAVYALDQGEVDRSADYLGRTLSAARTMMDGLLHPLGREGLSAGDLVRTRPASIGHDPQAPATGRER